MKHHKLQEHKHIAISKLGCTELIFINPGAKINGSYYRDILLMQHYDSSHSAYVGRSLYFSAG